MSSNYNMGYFPIDVTEAPPVNGKSKQDTSFAFRTLSVGRIPAGCNFKLNVGGKTPMPVEQGMIFQAECCSGIEGISYSWDQLEVVGPDGPTVHLYYGDGVTLHVPGRTEIPG